MQIETHKVKILGHAIQGGLELQVYAGKDPLSVNLRMGVLWHAGIVRFLLNHVRPGHIFLDIGAHIGLFSVLAGKLTRGKSPVVAFEPDSKNFSMLQNNVKGNNVAVDCRPLAISNNFGETVLYHDATNAGGHSLMALDGLDDPKTISVSTISREVSGLSRLDFLKLDVQGIEPALMADLIKVIGWFSAPPFVILEVNPRTWLRADENFSELENLIRQYDYDLHAFIGSEGISARPPRLRWTTFLAICDDIVHYSYKSQELDILLYPRVRVPPENW